MYAALHRDLLDSLLPEERQSEEFREQGDASETLQNRKARNLKQVSRLLDPGNDPRVSYKQRTTSLP
jgi:hypothetical protein